MPLDWGLGHATRCVPIIEKMLNAGFKVIIGATGDQKILLQTLFPTLEILPLPGYGLQYGTSKWRTILQIILQIPKILISINRENHWLRALIAVRKIDIVIADNRFGLYNKAVLSVFVTHQLHIKTLSGKLTDTLAQQFNYHFIKKFNYCWVPDVAGNNNLAGELSHPLKKPYPIPTYIGILPRFKKAAIPIKYELMILLSGPEPQRSILEKILLAQLVGYSKPVVLVRGLPSAKDSIPQTDLLTVYNFLSGPELEDAINQSDIVISRSGYSTIMDLWPLQKKCIFIPTPGQGEQEYLATYLSGKKYACTGSQHSLSLPLLLAAAAQLTLPSFTLVPDEEAITNAISVLKTKGSAG